MKERHDWRTETVTRVIETVRHGCGLGCHSRGRRGIALQFPSLRPRKRCVVCSCTTEFNMAAEESLNLPDKVDLKPGYDRIKNHVVRCAEVEAETVWNFDLAL